MERKQDFVTGPILSKLIRFALPILGALILQAMYGAVDLMVVGQYAGPADVSGVSTGSQLMMSITGLITGLAMGTTVLLGQRLGAGRRDEAGEVVGGAYKGIRCRTRCVRNGGDGRSRWTNYSENESVYSCAGG